MTLPTIERAPADITTVTTLPQHYCIVNECFYVFSQPINILGLIHIIHAAQVSAKTHGTSILQIMTSFPIPIQEVLSLHLGLQADSIEQEAICVKYCTINRIERCVNGR